MNYLKLFLLQILLSITMLSFSYASQDRLVPLKGQIKLAEKVVLGRIVKRIPVIEGNSDSQKKVCGWFLDIEVTQSFKGGDDSFRLFTNDSDTYVDQNSDYFIVAFSNPSYGTGETSEVGNCAEQSGLEEFMVQDPNGKPGDMVAMVSLKSYEKKYSELDISNVKYNSIMGRYGHEQYIFALDSFSKEKYGGDWLIQPEIYNLYDTVYTKFIEEGENKNYPKFYTAINFYDLLKETVYSKDANEIACDSYVNELLWLENANAKSDAINAVNNGNLKFMGVLGYALNFPGVADKEYSEVYKNGNYKIIKGTSDGICSNRHGQLNSIAIQYATQYNQIIIQNK